MTTNKLIVIFFLIHVANETMKTIVTAIVLLKIPSNRILNGNRTKLLQLNNDRMEKYEFINDHPSLYCLVFESPILFQISTNNQEC